ncbi:MAG TPA: VIT domain-containing protein [Thermoanaerobaculia bacterium]
MRALVLALILAFATLLGAQEPVTINSMQHPALLVKTSQPGLFIEAPTVHTNIALTIRGVVARGVVKQHFENTSRNCVEAVYVFPLSEGAAVDAMRMKIGERTIDGEIKEKAEAAAVYEQAKSEGKRASLLEQHRPNLFTVSVASIAPGEGVDIEIEFQEIVRFDAGHFSLRLPLAIGPRYTPRSDSSVPMPQMRFAATKPDRNPVELTIDLDGGIPLGTVLSPTHQLDTTPVSGSRVQLKPRDVRIASDRDFELVWTPRLGTMPQRASFSEVAGDQRYTLLMLFPPDVAAKPAAVLPRETIFILDTSGSMEGPSLVQAKQALLTAVAHLRSSDRFNIIEFSSSARRIFNESRIADRDTVKEALAWVQSLESTGGTEMMSAVQLAFDTPAKDGEIRQVIFITDGQVSNENEVFEYIRQHLGDSRLFTIGIGAAPNSYFMRNAARVGRGTFTSIGNIAEVESKMTSLFAKLESPVLSNLSLQTEANAEVWPEKLPDLYAGEPLVVTVKTPAAATKSIGRVVATNWNSPLDAPVDETQSGIAKLWAQQKIDAVRDRLFTGTDRNVVKADIVKLGVEHHLVTEYTSLVAVDTTPTGIDAQSCKSELVPLNLPAGWGGMDGALPQTGTASTLSMLIGLLLLLAAIVIRRL